MRALKLLWLLPMLVLAASPAAALGPPIIFFEFGSARLTAHGEAQLDWIIVMLREANAESIHIDGCADRAGSASANMRLSRRRAEATRDGLIRRGFPADRITIRAYGETRPLVETADGVRESSNRNAQIVIDSVAPSTH